MKNIVLTGFMGTGKTEVGRAVAQRLGREFVDMDAEIEARAGKSIPSIFAQDEEEAFRSLERKVCRDLSKKEGLVIATGGGALMDPENRALMLASGTVICLIASAEEVLRHLRGTDISKRPLLGNTNLHETIESLLHERREIYRSFTWQINTDDLTIPEVADHVINIARSMTIPVRYPGGEYEIRIGDGLLHHLGELLRGKVGGRIAIVTNTVVAPLYAATVERSLHAAGLDSFTAVIPDGEEHKTLSTVQLLYEKFLGAGLDRTSAVVSLGGGVTGDIAGFAAATYMRGIKFIQVPTTLLSMIDASVGGKTGVDLPQGKNLVGAFKFPELVLIDPHVLSTLPKKEIRNGAAEAIKHGIIADPNLFATLKDGPTEITPELIDIALRVKVKIVERDPYEQDQRMVLNLGHTVGHALERVSGFSISHGNAVAIGLVAAARIAVRLGRADHDLVGRIEDVLSAWGLPFRVPGFPPDQVIAAMAHDKKRLNGRLRFVIPRKIGRVEIMDDVPPDVIWDILNEMEGE